MKRIIINSNINMETVALMCAHIQNVQTHALIITDSFVFMKYGERLNIGRDKIAEAGLTGIYCTKHDDVVIAITPDLLKATTTEEIEDILHKTETLITNETLETVEATTVYLGSTIISEELIQDFCESSETTFVDFNNYKGTSKITDTFNWSEESTETTENTNDKIAYTCIFDKKLHKKAATLKRPVLLITPKDLQIIMNSERLEEWKVTGLAKSLAVEIICKHTGVNKEAVEAWINTPASK